jgi:hypothetical protein
MAGPSPPLVLTESDVEHHVKFKHISSISSLGGLTAGLAFSSWRKSKTFATLCAGAVGVLGGQLGAAYYKVKALRHLYTPFANHYEKTGAVLTNEQKFQLLRAGHQYTITQVLPKWAGEMIRFHLLSSVGKEHRQASQSDVQHWMSVGESVSRDLTVLGIPYAAFFLRGPVVFRVGALLSVGAFVTVIDLMFKPKLIPSAEYDLKTGLHQAFAAYLYNPVYIKDEDYYGHREKLNPNNEASAPKQVLNLQYRRSSSVNNIHQDSDNELESSD